jgi:hypothetical protein
LKQKTIPLALLAFSTDVVSGNRDAHTRRVSELAVYTMEEKTLRLQWDDDSADEYEVRDGCLFVQCIRG